MEISKLTICRQDVIVVSDTDSETNKLNLHKKKKLKRKTKCVRNVKLTTMTVNRIVPFCYRQRCRNCQHYHRQTSKNTKYRKRTESPEKITYDKSGTLAKRVPYKTHKVDNDINMTVTRDMYSPITVASSSDTYENISSCSFNILSSDSDELEDLINLTRKRMRNDSVNFNSYSLRKSMCAASAQDDYQNISSNDEMLDSSIHSMDTVLLYHGDSCRSPEHFDEVCLKQNNNNIKPKSSCRSPTLDSNSNELHEPKIPTLSSQDNKDNLSPLYEISGKVFMEHYLNTSFV